MKNQNEEPINSGKIRKEKETENRISGKLSKGNQENEIPDAELAERKVSEITENEFSEEASEMNEENSLEISESGIQNEEEEESQKSDTAEFSELRDGSGVTVPRGAAPSDSPPDDNGVPGYLKILRNVYERSGSPDNEGLTFTFDEMCYLAADPNFCQIYPQAAEEFQAILKEIEDG